MSRKNEIALRIAIEQLVMHKRALFESSAGDDHKPCGFVGLGSGFWLRVEVLAALLDLPPAKAEQGFFDDWARDKAAALLEAGEHPWVCGECHRDRERLGPAELQGASVVAAVYGEQTPRCFRCGQPAAARLRVHPHRWGSDIEPFRF